VKSCERCGRPLEEDEDKLCPSCESKKSYKIKKWVQGFGGAIVGIAIYIITKGKGGENA